MRTLTRSPYFDGLLSTELDKDSNVTEGGINESAEEFIRHETAGHILRSMGSRVMTPLSILVHRSGDRVYESGG